jgi:hypothetical protein
VNIKEMLDAQTKTVKKMLENMSEINPMVVIFKKKQLHTNSGGWWQRRN